MSARRTLRAIADGQDLRTLPPDASVQDAARTMALHRIGAVLIMHEDGPLLGIITERDVVSRVVAENRPTATTTVAAVMTPDPETIEPDRDSMEALRRMHEGGFRHLPIIDGGVVTGIVSLRDFLGAELQALEDELERRRRIIEG